MKEVDLEKLEEATFEVGKEAFRPKVLHCCKLRMDKKELGLQVDGDITIRLAGFECTKCGKQYLGVEEAIKLDKALILSRAVRGGFKMVRNLSFDGDNYTFRIPKEFTRTVNKKKIEIIPLSAREFCATVE